VDTFLPASVVPVMAPSAIRSGANRPGAKAVAMSAVPTDVVRFLDGLMKVRTPLAREAWSA